MTDQYKKQLASVSRLALNGCLVEAIDSLIALARQLNDNDILSKAEKLQDNYEAALRFLAQGVAGDNLNDLTDTVVAEVLALTMRISRSLSMADSPEIYFSTARTYNYNSAKDLKALTKEYREELSRLDNDFDSITDPKRSVKAESMLTAIFNRIWTTHPLSGEDFEAISALASSAFPRHARLSTVSAVGLGHRNYYDSNRLAWLLSKYVEYIEREPEIALYALVEALIGILRYRRRPISDAVKKVLLSAKESASWQNDLASVTIELMRAVTTEDISEKMKNGILSQLGDMDEMIREKLSKGELSPEMFEEEFNPEWADEINHSKLGENLREMSEIQSEGGDIFMSTFSHMKRYSFFHEVANWFLPFYDSHSQVASNESEDGTMSSFLSLVPALCDSDKYSLILSVTSIPAAQRDQLTNALRAQSEHMAESLSEVEKASGSTLHRHIINKYLQNLYRFYNLFRSRSDFNSPFDGKQTPNLLDVAALNGSLSDIEIIETIAQFYFKNKFWQEAANTLAYLEENDTPSARRLQQLGYALEKIGRPEDAIDAYEQAEMLNPNSEWTLRRLAYAFYNSGQYSSAYKRFAKIVELNPDDALIATDYARALFHAGEYQKAEQAFHKIAYLLPGSLEPLRFIAWIQFISGDLEKAANSYQDLIYRGADSDDLKNAAIVNWAKGSISDAITLFRLATQDSVEAINDLKTYIIDNKDAIERAGGDFSQLPYIIETLKFLRKQ